MGKMMKRVFAGVFVAAVVLGVSTISAFAAGPGAGRSFTDANGDGVCDYRENDCRYADADNDGICDCIGSGNCYTDSDGDGVCDYAAGRGLGQGKGFRGGRGR